VVEYRELVEVYNTYTSMEAGFVKSLMDSNGIESYIHNLHLSSIYAIGSSAVPIKIMVPADDKENMEKAREIIEEYLKDR